MYSLQNTRHLEKLAQCHQNHHLEMNTSKIEPTIGNLRISYVGRPISRWACGEP